MELSAQQSAAVQAVRNWLDNSDNQCFRLWAFAGTGKSTIAKAFVGPFTLFAAYTGKAALVLQNKGVYAQTIHSLIYVPATQSKKAMEELELELQDEMLRTPPDAQRVAQLEVAIRQESARLKQPRFAINLESAMRSARLLVVDEVSMVGEQVGKDILSFGKKVLVLGDPAQLPPVGSGGFFTKQEPDFLLTEVHRQAQDSPVLRLATMVREGGTLSEGTFGQSRVLPKGTLSIADVAAHDQLIVGTNRTRRAMNQALRRHYGKTSPIPQQGDRLVCLRNNHDLALLNGGQWTVQGCTDLGSDKIGLTVSSEDCSRLDVVAWRHYFEGREEELKPWEVVEAQAFDFGYALTCHKSQGSQWGSVMVIDESKVFGADRRRWLYTAITRASEMVTVVR